MSVYKKLPDNTQIKMSRGVVGCHGSSSNWDFETTVGEAKKNGWFDRDGGTTDWSADIIGSNDVYNLYRMNEDSPPPALSVKLIRGKICALVSDDREGETVIKSGYWTQDELNQNAPS